MSGVWVDVFFQNKSKYFIMCSDESSSLLALPFFLYLSEPRSWSCIISSVPANSKPSRYRARQEFPDPQLEIGIKDAIEMWINWFPIQISDIYFIFFLKLSIILNLEIIHSHIFGMNMGRPFGTIDAVYQVISGHVTQIRCVVLVDSSGRTRWSALSPSNCNLWKLASKYTIHLR